MVSWVRGIEEWETAVPRVETGRKADRLGREELENDERGGRGTSIGKGEDCNTKKE